MKIITAILFVFLVQFSGITQVVYEPLNKDIYYFLERFSYKGLIQLDDLVKPLSRKYIAEKLVELRKNIDALTNIEKDELEFYEKDYYWEINFVNGNETPKYLHYFEKDAAGRYNIFSFSDPIFKFNVKPLLGVQLNYVEKDKNFHTIMGLNAHGYLLNSIGFNFDIRSNNERGDGIDAEKIFTPETGVIPEVHDMGRDVGYNDVNTSLSVDWGWGNASIVKDYLEYGYAKFGNIVLSKKAPSFPQIRLQIKPTDWFNFYYFHAWLNSNVIDSVNVAAYKRGIYISKHFAWHALVVTPFKGFDVSIGESVVYSDKLEVVYLMPVMFYFFADEFVSNRVGKPGDANQQIFLSVSSKNHIKNTHLYGTLFVDEMTIGGINGSLLINPTYGGATSRRQRTQLGFTLGMSVADIPIDNLTLDFEYTRINPFVYGHHDPAQTYTSSSYLMGHWMGHNSDLVYADLKYTILRGLRAELWGAYLRKGSNSYAEQYGPVQPDFLFGLRNNYKYFGFNLKYEWLHDLKFETHYKLTSRSIEQDDGSFEDFSISEMSLLVSYGL